MTPGRGVVLVLWALALLGAPSSTSALRVPALADRLFGQETEGVRGGGASLQPVSVLERRRQQRVASSGVQVEDDATRKPEPFVVGEVEPHLVPSIELAARQFLFNYGAQRGLDILRDRVQELQVPDVAKSFNLPLVGEFKLQLSNIHVTQFNASSSEAKFTILDGNFDLWVTQVEAQVLFNWHWEKLGMQGTGTGELDLHGGSIDYKFSVSTNADAKPLLLVDSVASRFESVELQIRSFSADWLYQAVMSLFNDQIQKAIQNGIANALQNDVPNGINKVLATLPTRVDVKGLPFSAEFQYSIFDLTYVMVKGYGMVDTGGSSSSSRRRHLHSTSASATTTTSSSTSASSSSTSSQVASGAGDRGLAACPFPAVPLPLSPEQIAADGRMTTIYLHQSMVNCLSWGLFTSNLMQFDLVDGTIPKLHLTTDLLAMLIPQLPKTYPHQLLRITGEALAMPQVSFDSQGFTLEASYRTSVFVANETAGNPKIVTMAANLTIKGQINYDTTVITSAVVRHTVEEALMPVSAPQWDNTVAWFIQNYAGLYPLQFLIEHFVQTPVTSLVSLVNAAASTFDGGWYALSGDVVVHDA